MRITVLVEGETEKRFLAEICHPFFRDRLPKGMPKLDSVSYRHLLPVGEHLKREVERLLGERSPADAVIALTDVYTGRQTFRDAADAKEKMRDWVGPEPRFHPHAAQYEFEAWLLPYWDDVQKLAGRRKAHPGSPEQVNHGNPPSRRIQELFAGGKRGYKKVQNAISILKNKDLMIAANACPELKALLNTILRLCEGVELS